MLSVYSKVLIFIFSTLFVNINCGFWSPSNNEPKTNDTAPSNQALAVADIFVCFHSRIIKSKPME